MTEFRKTNKAERIFLSLQSKLPFKLKKEIQDLYNNELILNDEYHNDNNVFGILDRNEKIFIINHKNGYYNLNMTLDILDQNLFQTKSEIKFLKATKNIENWCNKLRDKLMKDYGR